MPFLDRFWWLRVAGGVALIVAAITLANVYSASIHPGASAAASRWPGAIFWPLLPLLALAIAFWWSYGAWVARQRASAIRRARSGDPDAIPFAAFSGHPAQAPALGAPPLVIRWRPNHGIQRAVWLIALLTVALDLMIVYGAHQIMSVKLPIPISLSSFWPRLALIALALLLLSLHIAVLLAAPLALRLRTGVTFTDDGVVERGSWGWRRSLRWEEARLFEVESIQTLARRYTLYGQRGAVQWRDDIPTYDSEAIQQRDHENYVPDGISPEEMSRRLRLALHLVAARTGLAPHTLSPTLQASASMRLKPQPVTPLQLRLRLAGALGSVFATGLTLPLFFLPAALGIAFVAWPPTASRTITIISGVALVAASQILLIALALSLSHVAPRKRASVIDVTDMADVVEKAAPDLAGGARYLLRLPGSYLSRPWSTALGLLLLIGGVPGLILLCLFVAEYVSVLFFPSRVEPLASAFPHTIGSLVVAILSLCAAIIGLSLTTIALSTNRPWRRQVQADMHGLRVEHGAITRALPWDAIETLTLICVGPTPTTYRLTADSGKISLSWPAQTEALVGGGTPKGTAFLAPDGLAALIERQPSVRRRIQVIGLPEPPQLALPEQAESSPSRLSGESGT
jgi:hypothetical protein